VTSPDERADNSARNAAIKLVEEALKSGRIVQADHDMRIDQLRSAQTMQDVEMQVRDLRAPGPSSPPTVAPVPPTPTGQPTPGAGQQWPLVNYGPASTHEAADISAAVSKGGKAIGGIIAVIVLIAVIVPIAGAAIAFFAARDSFPDFGDVGPTDETTYLPGQAPGEDGVNVHTVEGYQDMVDALRDETGQTYTFTTVIYPRYAVLDVPTGVNERYEGFYWDGETLEKNTTRGSSSDDQVDLSLVDPNQIIEMLNTVRDRLDSPDSWYVVISDHELTDPQISAYASNDFGETTYLVAGLDGVVIYDSDAVPDTES
jgi:hypothetical protein